MCVSMTMSYGGQWKGAGVVMDYVDEKCSHHSHELWQKLPIKTPLPGPGGLNERKKKCHILLSKLERYIKKKMD